MKYFGKYRGTVVGTQDPMLLGRLRVEVPSVTGQAQVWAMPCVPYAGPRVGLFALPPPGAQVWVEFEAGDIDAPIWTGCFWGQGQLPVTPQGPAHQVFALRTAAFSLVVDEAKGRLELEIGAPVSPTPVQVVVDAKGVKMKRKALDVVANDAGLTITLGQTKVELAAGQANLASGKVAIDAPQGASIEAGGGKAEVTPSAVQLGCGPGRLNVSQSGAELACGGASVALDLVKVTVNKGALEVV